MSFSVEIMRREHWLCQKIGCMHVFDGDTTWIGRKPKVRAWIIENNLAANKLGTQNGADRTVAWGFERVYGEPLEVAP